MEELDRLKHCPVMFQEQIFGETLRVHIVGDKVVLALKIITTGRVDSRTATTGAELFKMPDSEAEKIVKANRFLGLHYAAWDIIFTIDGRFVYLDCNPGPCIMWIGVEFRRFVFEQMGKYMVAYALTGSIERAAEKVSVYNQECLAPER